MISFSSIFSIQITVDKPKLLLFIIYRRDHTLPILYLYLLNTWCAFNHSFVPLPPHPNATLRLRCSNQGCSHSGQRIERICLFLCEIMGKCFYNFFVCIASSREKCVFMFFFATLVRPSISTFIAYTISVSYCIWTRRISMACHATFMRATHLMFYSMCLCRLSRIHSTLRRTNESKANFFLFYLDFYSDDRRIHSQSCKSFPFFVRRARRAHHSAQFMGTMAETQRRHDSPTEPKKEKNKIGFKIEKFFNDYSIRERRAGGRPCAGVSREYTNARNKPFARKYTFYLRFRCRCVHLTLMRCFSA